MQDATTTNQVFRRRAINLLIVAAVCAGYIVYRYLTTSSTTALSWIVLGAVLITSIYYFRVSRR
jgi:hypothetical protein